MLKSIRAFLSNILNTLFLAVLEALIGLFMIISASGLAVGIFLVAGVLLIADGVVRCIAYFRDPAEQAQKGHKLASGLFMTVFGLFTLFNHSFIVGIFPAIAALYAILAMISVFLKIEKTVTLIREKKHIWYIMICSLLFSFIAMMILFGSPVPFVGAGIMFFLAAAVDLFFYLCEKGKVSVPTLSELTRAAVDRISRSGKDAVRNFREPEKRERVVDRIPVEEPRQTSVPDQQTGSEPKDAPVSDQTKEEIDPADEDMSWANVPQLKMPE